MTKVRSSKKVTRIAVAVLIVVASVGAVTRRRPDSSWNGNAKPDSSWSTGVLAQAELDRRAWR